MSAVDDYARNNEQYAPTHAGGAPGRPSRHIAIVACMDSRMGISPMLGTREIMLIHHTDCGMQKTTDDEFKRAVEAETGISPHWAVESFGDAEQDVRQSIGRLMASPFIPHKDAIRGFVFDVDTGKLNEVA
jgi:carbonic anhydrase